MQTREIQPYENIMDPKDITVTMIREFLDYDPYTGIFTYKERLKERFKTEGLQKLWNRRYSNKRADRPRNGANDYRYLIIYRVKVYAHRAAFAFMEGRWPTEIDHINRKKADNRWENLREVSHRQNHMNRGKSTLNTTGFRGVYLDKRRGSYYVQTTAPNGDRKVKSGFSDPVSAHKHLLRMRARLHNQYHNKE